MNAPQTFSEALELAVAAANDYLARVIEYASASALLDQCEHDLISARRLGFSEDYIARAELRREHAGYAVEIERAALEYEDGRAHVWNSGYHFDDNANEYAFHVYYRRRDWDYEVVRSDEGGEYFHGFFPTLKDAIDFAESITYPQEAEARAAPSFTREESTAAGEVLIDWRGDTQPIRAVVDRILEEANQGCGQHYEIFARRASSALNDLISCTLRPEAKAALQKYVAYDRY